MKILKQIWRQIKILRWAFVYKENGIYFSTESLIKDLERNGRI